MAAYMDITLQDSMTDYVHCKVQHSRYTLHALERKCCSSAEKLKSVLRDYLQNGIPASDILERTLSFLTVKKVLLHHNGYTRCSRDILRYFPTSAEDVAPLYYQQ